ncbi:serine/threonine protein kinase [Phormidium pseudopriestleyi FRX01]|uniref:non-specific serine/threonine protein kinase n=1 Tax=Phormidium pseudopriestleyi FRX01 TaxID=1759528 RepID=A0ABS3FVL2_9CYAN|nr:serine/threonine-protein kinase [Phormidium pseudopriestleyi]MBO0351168.1 serine/threonine protein kinase [Phormidium pseudopriestleyi FRX01]
MHQPEEIIKDRYRILKPLGKGGIATTYAAHDLDMGQEVAIKALSLRRLKDWKSLELFEREGRVLSQLNHPGIPNYLDYFQLDTDDDRRFYIVQEIAPGKSLQDWVESGWHPTELEVRDLAQQLLEILVYLHQISPPVIHRDIKPPNIIRQSEGKILLIDFGAVKDTYRHTMTSGSTLVGTYGYMAPEQFRGQAEPATDLYGLGATLLFLLTHKTPADFPEKRLKIDFRPSVNISPELGDWLERLLEPLVEDRFISAVEALAVLQSKKAISKVIKERVPERSANHHQLAGSRVFLKITPGKLEVKIPFLGWKLQSLSLIVIITILNVYLVAAVWLAAIQSLAILSFLFLLLGLEIKLLGNFLLNQFGRVSLEFDETQFYLTWNFLGIQRKIQGNIHHISSVQVFPTWLSIQNYPIITCALQMRFKTYRFGSGLTQTEREWIAMEIAAFLGKPHLIKR